MTTLTGKNHKTSQQYIELGASRIKHDNDVTLHDPFFENETMLKNIPTGLTTTESYRINCEAEKIGQEMHGKLNIAYIFEVKIEVKIYRAWRKIFE